MESLYFYPTLNDDLMNASGCTLGKYNFSYFIEGRNEMLDPKGKRVIELTDRLETWKIEVDGIHIKRSILFEYPDALYGPDGLAAENAKLGACIIWKNKTLTQMGHIMPKVQMISNGPIRYDFDCEFKPGQIKGDLTLETILYIEKAANILKCGENILCNTEGASVGTIDEITLDFDSAYMDFPVRDVCEQDRPLWWLTFGDWEDPSTEPFNEESVCLYLNSYYSYCPKVGDQIKNIELLIEIISTAYFMIFYKIREKDEKYFVNTINGTDLEPGSISMMMYYFRIGCDDFQAEPIEALQMTIRRNVEEMLRVETS